MRTLFLLATAAVCCGCLGLGRRSSPDEENYHAALRFSPRMALPLGVPPLYQKAAGALTYPTSTTGEVRQYQDLGPVQAEACQWALIAPLGPATIVVNLESSSYQAAYKRALNTAQGDLLYDIRADSKVFSVLAIYTRVCTQLSGRAAKIASAATPATPPTPVLPGSDLPPPPAPPQSDPPPPASAPL